MCHLTKMKRLIVALVFSLHFVALTIANTSPDRWTTGLKGKAIYTVAVDPSNPKVVYAGTDRGLLKSTNGGTIWAFLKVGSPDVSRIHHLVIDPQRPRSLYASTDSEFGGGRLFKSTDGGETWALIHTAPGLHVLVIDPNHPEVLYAGVNHVGFLKSIDGGSNWKMIGDDPGVTVWHIEVSALVFDPTNPAILYAGTVDGGVLKSTDTGASWTNILWAGDNQPVEDGRDLRIYSINDIAVAPTQPTTLYVSTHGRGILKSIDGGTKWQELDRRLLYVRTVAIDPTVPAVLYAAPYDGISMSTDSGEHWQSLQFSSAPLDISAMTVNPTGTALYVGTEHGVSVYRLGK